MAWVLVAFVVLLTGTVVVLIPHILRLARPADFDRRPSAARHTVERTVPLRFGYFQRVEPPQPADSPHSWRACYTGAGGEVALEAVRASSEEDAVHVLRRLRRVVRVGKGRQAVFASRLGGDHSFIVQQAESGRLIGWTNGPWAFIATSDNPALLADFVQSFPF